MIFKQVSEIISGQKTQTRRVVKSEERMAKVPSGTPLEFMEIGTSWGDIVAIRQNNRFKWRLFWSYAVVSKPGTRGVMWEPGTGKWYVPESVEDVREGYVPLRVRVTGIRREPLQAITEADARAEGVESCGDYLRLWQSINDRAGVRWHDNPDVWVITFEVVR